MKKLYFALVALFVTMSINAQVIKVYKNGGAKPVGKYINTETDKYKVVFEEAQAGEDPNDVVDDYSALSGEWVKSSDGTSGYIFYADGTMEQNSLTSYKYIPGNGYQLGLIYIYFSNGTIQEILIVHELTTNQLVVSDYADYNHSNSSFGTQTTYVRKVSVTGISVDPTTITSQPGNTHQLTATLTPSTVTNKYVNWSSNNTDVATVSKTGLVTIVGYGSCNISANATDGSGLKATCTVNVPRYVQSITLDRTSLILHKSQTYSLTATASPVNADNKAVTWSSSDTNIATVSADGTVTGKANGTATITCTAQDGSGVATTCTVTVPTPGYVDLGLPSGTLWATFNVGASTPYEIGEEFRWGETDYYPTGVNNSWSLYKWANGEWNKLTKYCTDADYGNDGFIDGKKELDAEDDAATYYWGNDWCTPTAEQWQELIDNCTWTECWKGKNGELYDGYLVTSKIAGYTNSSIFIPASGRYDAWVGRLAWRVFLSGYYWSKNIGASENQCLATSFYFNDNHPSTNLSDRYHGRRIRPVHKYLKGVRP